MNSNQHITYLSKPEQVSMGDAWFEYATVDHFWIKRRFNILSKLLNPINLSGLTIGEVGSGSGTVQRQFELYFQKSVDGFDLNEFAQKNTITQSSRTFCYNIHDRNINLKEKYDILILFDVIEHITNAHEFIESALFHLKKDGYLIINVPAHQYLFSNYDKAAGHIKRYAPKDFELIGNIFSLTTIQWTFWGLMYIPILILRKAITAFSKDKNKILTNGFSKKSKFINSIMSIIGQIEFIPQHITGTSLMWIFKK